MESPAPAPTNVESEVTGKGLGALSSDDRSQPAHSGDLARRVNARRISLGLSTEELARQAGVDAWFLAYFLQSSETSLSGGALLRIAVTLQTTPLALEGGLIDRPPGIGRAGAHPVLEGITADQCKTHLAPGGIGRIVFTTGSGPVALPVNYVFTDERAFFLTDDDTARSVVGIVAFEVDRIDETMSQGWSVLLRGHAVLVDDLDVRRSVHRLNLQPWAGGTRHCLIAITPFEVTGRVVTQRITADTRDHHSERGSS